MTKPFSFILILFLAGVCYAHDSNIVETEIETKWSVGRSVLIFNAYQFGSSSTEFVSGSTTVNGGTSTVDAGVIDVRSLVGNKEFLFKNSGGSTTVNVYGFIGTSGAVGRCNLLTMEMSGSTNTVWVLDKNVEAMHVGIICHNGTSTFTSGLTNIRSRVER